jgi:glycosyltransferase involved in cell wall biosynthesis
MQVTILLPAFNHAEFIEDALQSCYEQDYNDIELVIADDNSDDGSQAIIDSVVAQRRFSQRFRRIKKIHRKRNLGSLANIADALKHTRGELIHILNTDDRFHPTRVSRSVSAASDPFCWGFSHVTPIGQNGEKFEGELPPTLADTFGYYSANVGRMRFPESLFLYRNVAISTGNLFFSRHYASLFDRLVWMRYCGDWAFALAAAYIAKPTILEEPLLQYRIHRANSFVGLREVGEHECDFLAVLSEVLFRSASPPNQNFSNESNRNWLKLIYADDSYVLNIFNRQQIRAAQGVSILTSLEFANQALLLKNQAQQVFESSARQRVRSA